MLRATCVLLLGLFACARGTMEAFVVGGNFANIAHHAQSAFLKINCKSKRDGTKSSYICGASVVNQKILLTAGHCLHECTYESHIAITMGDEDWQRGLTYSIHSFMVHENYKPETSSNDICLLRADRSLNLNSKISRVALMKHPPYSEDAKVAGWGMVDEINEYHTNLLKYVSQKVMRRTDCIRVFGYLAQGTLCASSDKSEEYASKGDSGCALLVRGYIQIGLVSYKIPSLARNIVVYTDVGYFYDWIRMNSVQLVCNQ